MLSKKLFLSSIVLFVLVSFPLISSVGASSEMWSQTYGGTSSDSAAAMVQTSDGGYAIAGYTESFGAGSYDFWLVKTDGYGNMEWNQTYGGAGIDHHRSLVETSDGGYALAGYTTSFGAGSADFWLVKTDGYGNMEWNQTYGEADYDRAYALVETSDGGYAIAGTTLSFGAGSWDFWLVKTDINGVMEWNRTYGRATDESAYSLVETSDVGFALAGYTYSWDPATLGAGDYDFWLVKTDANGVMEWNQTYAKADGDKAHSLVKTFDGGYAIAGETYNATYSPEIQHDFWLVKTDGYGNMEWNQTYGGASIEVAYALVETSDGGYAIAGETTSFGAGSYDFWLVKTDEHGIIPEFPSWTILPLLFIASFAAIICKQRLLRKLANN